MNFGPYSVKITKMFRSMEGNGFNCTMLKNGKKIGLVDDEGCGGSVRADFNDKAEQAEFDAFLATLPPEPSEYFPDGHKVDEDYFFGEAISEALKVREATRLRKMLTKKTVFRLKGESHGSYRVMSVPFDEKVKTLITTKYGDKIEFIANMEPDKFVAFATGGIK